MQRAQPEEWTGREVARLLALVESERRYYQEIIAAIPLGLLVVSSDLAIVSSNRAGRRIVHPECGNALRGQLDTIMPGWAVEKIREVFETCEPLLDLIFEQNGRRLRASASVIRNGDEQRDPELLISIEDLTGIDSPAPRTSANTEQHSIAQPARAEAIELLKSLDAILWAADIPSRNFLLVTSTAQEVLGFAPDHWLQTPGFWSDRIEPADRQSILESYRGAIERRERHSCEFRSKTADGRVVWVRETARILTDANGEPKHLIGLTVDVTERRQLEQQYVRAERVEAVTRLSGRLAHDLNNMLMIVNGYGEELVRQIPAREPFHADLQEILSATGRIRTLTDQLIAYTQRQPSLTELLDIGVFLRQIEPTLRKSAGTGLEVRVQAGEGVLARVARDQLSQLLTSMVARSAASPQPGSITITVEESRISENLRGIERVPGPGRYAVLSIEDTTRRLAHDAQMSLFESFLPGRELPGETGAILSRAYALVRQWGGDISVADLDKGARVSIYLPSEDHKEDRKRAEAPERDTHALRPAEEPAVILLVEDETGIRALVRKILHRQGYTVLEAANGVEGMRVSQQHTGKVDLLLTDVVMPGIGGRELAKRVLQQRPGIKVLYMSGYTEDNAFYTADLPAGTSFIQKPFTLGSLVEKVKSILAG